MSSATTPGAIATSAGSVRGTSAPRCPERLRPPVDRRLRDAAAAAIRGLQLHDKDPGVPLVLWNVDPADWRDRDAAIVAARVLANTRPGSIVLLHDVHPSTVAAVPAIVAGLKARATPSSRSRSSSAR